MKHASDGLVFCSTQPATRGGSGFNQGFDIRRVTLLNF